MNYPPIPIRLSVTSYHEFVQESRLEDSVDGPMWSVDCNGITDFDSRDIIRAIKAHVSVSLGEYPYEGECQIGRLSQPETDEGRLLSASIGLRETEFLKFVKFVRSYGHRPIELRLGIYSPEVSEDDFNYGKWDKKPFPEILTFSYSVTIEAADPLS